MPTLRSSIKVDVQVQGASRIAGVTKELERAGVSSQKLAAMELRLHTASAARQRQTEQGQFRLQQAASKIAQQQEAREAKAAANAAKQAARSDSLRARTEAAEAKNAARAELRLAKQAAQEQQVRNRQLALIERNADRAAAAAERAATREKRAIVSVESEMERLQKLEQRRAATADARQRLGLPPTGRGGGFLAGHGFTNRGRQALGVARDITVAGYGLYGMARAGVGLAESVMDPFAQFEASMADARGKGGWDAAQTAAVAKTARGLGKTSTFSATQAASATVDLAAAGLSPEDIQSALPTTLRFAQASQLSPESASGTLISAQNQFGLGVDKLDYISDTMVHAASLSKISVSDLAESLDKVGPLASAAGMSLSDVAGTISYLGKQGIVASEAGTGLRTVLASLVKPSKQSKNALATLGLSKEQLAEGIKDLPKFMELLAEKMKKKNLSSAQRLGILTGVFGREGLTLAQNLIKDPTDWANFRKNAGNSEGDTAKQAALAADTYKGKMARLNATVEEAKIQLAEKFAPALEKEVIPALSRAALATGEWMEKHTALQNVLAGGAIAGGALVAGGVASGLGAAVGGALASGAGSLAVGMAGWITAGLGQAFASTTLLTAVTVSGGSLAATLMAAMAAGIVGYGIGKAVMAALDVDGEDIGAKVYDFLHGTGVEKAPQRGMPLTPADMIEMERRKREGTNPANAGPLSNEEWAQRGGKPGTDAQGWITTPAAAPFKASLEVKLSQEGRIKSYEILDDGQGGLFLGVNAPSGVHAR